VHEPSESELEAERESMVKTQIAARGLIDDDLLAAFRAVPRHLFVPAALRHEAYWDGPLSIGYGQTISQPYIVALMTSLLGPLRGATILEIGSGSGYQSAILARMCKRVIAIELLQPLVDRASLTLASLGVDNVLTLCRDGRQGAPEHMPPGGYQGILVAATTSHPPPALLDQLAYGARLVIPLGPSLGYQELVTIERRHEGFIRTPILPVRFVPLVDGASRLLD
jgi:protein-L-isoaspartate(D-aspartate) O-methyltransferase